MPVLFFKDATKNELLRKFYGRIPVEEINTLLSFSKEGKTKKLIHELKYNGNENIGIFLGNWIGELLIENKQFSEVDFIVPVPLHHKKLKRKRIQSTYKVWRAREFLLE